MWPDRVSKPGPLIYESDALPTGAYDKQCSLCKMVLKSDCTVVQTLLLVILEFSIGDCILMLISLIWWIWHIQKLTFYSISYISGKIMTS